MSRARTALSARSRKGLIHNLVDCHWCGQRGDTDPRTGLCGDCADEQQAAS